MRASIADALTAPAPHHTRPVRFVWVRTPAVRDALLTRMREQWRTDLAADGMSADAVDARVARGNILFDAPEVIIPFCVPDGAHHYPDKRRQAAEATMFTVAAGAAVQALLVSLATKGIGSCWIGSTIFAPDTRPQHPRRARRLATPRRDRRRPPPRTTDPPTRRRPRRRPDREMTHAQ